MFKSKWKFSIFFISDSVGFLKENALKNLHHFTKEIPNSFNWLG